MPIGCDNGASGQADGTIFSTYLETGQLARNNLRQLHIAPHGLRLPDISAHVEEG